MDILNSREANPLEAAFAFVKGRKAIDITRWNKADFDAPFFDLDSDVAGLANRLMFGDAVLMAAGITNVAKREVALRVVAERFVKTLAETRAEGGA